MAQRVFQNQAGIRHQPISDRLVQVLTSVGDELNVYFDVTSGGQPASGPNRTGTHRHDDGNAADTKAFTVAADGSRHYLNMADPADRGVWSRILQLSVGSGAEGVGAAPDYMGNYTAHIGFGTPGAWGAGGHTRNAPDWVTAAFDAGKHTPPLAIPSGPTAPVPFPRPAALSTPPAPNVSGSPDERSLFGATGQAMPTPGRPAALGGSYGPPLPPLPIPRPAPPRPTTTDGSRAYAPTLGADGDISSYPGSRAGVEDYGPGVTGTPNAAFRVIDGGPGALADPRTAALQQPALNATSMVGAGRPGVVAPNTMPPLPQAPRMDGVGTGPSFPGAMLPPTRAAQGMDAAGRPGNLPQAPAPPMPVPMPGRPPTLTAAPAAPQTATAALPTMPLPGRPAGLNAAPTAAPPSTPAPAPQLLTLPSGKLIAPGLYNQGSHTVAVTDGGNGMAKVERITSPGAIPGIIDPLREVNNKTVAGGVIRSMLPQAVSGAVSSFASGVPQAIDNVKNQAVQAATNIGSQISGFGSNIGSAFSGMFGGAPATAPRPPAANNPWSPMAAAGPMAMPGAPHSQIPTSAQLAAIRDVSGVQQPMTTFVTKQVPVANPAYADWVSRNVGGNTRDAHGKANVQTSAPSQYLMTTVKVPVAPAPAAPHPSILGSVVRGALPAAPRAGAAPTMPIAPVVRDINGNPIRQQNALGYDPRVDVTGRSGQNNAGGWGINAGGGIVPF